MNNNMPNNFNNGLNGNTGNGFNNNGVNPFVADANAQLVGGQSSVGNGPSLAQGFNNTNDGGIMQGIANVDNNSVMQGAPANPEMNAMPRVDVNMMPGQGNSGIDPMTMQVQNPDTVSYNQNIQADPVVMPSVTDNVMPQNDTFNNLQNANGFYNQPVEPASNSLNQTVGFNNNNVQEPVLDSVNAVNQEANNSVNPFGVNFNQPVEPTSNSLNQAVGFNNNVQEPVFNSVNAVNQEVNSTPVSTFATNFNQPMNDVPSNNQNMSNPADTDINDVNAINNVNSINTDFNNQPAVNSIGNISSVDVNSTNENFSKPAKSFPLSVREIVLIAIALIGVIAVVILYWPN